MPKYLIYGVLCLHMILLKIKKNYTNPLYYKKTYNNTDNILIINF